MIGIILNIIHFIIIFVPMLIYFIPNKYIFSYVKYFYLILTLIPVQWVLLNDKCILSIISKNDGALEEDSFSDVYLKWLYEPILVLFDQDWNKKENRDKMVHLHYGLNVILMWIYIFIKN
jgi:hypothetical protein